MCLLIHISRRISCANSQFKSLGTKKVQWPYKNTPMYLHLKLYSDDLPKLVCLSENWKSHWLITHEMCLCLQGRRTGAVVAPLTTCKPWYFLYPSSLCRSRANQHHVKRACIPGWCFSVLTWHNRLCFVKSMCEMIENLPLLQVVENPGHLEAGSFKDSCYLVPMMRCVQGKEGAYC